MRGKHLTLCLEFVNAFDTQVRAKPARVTPLLIEVSLKLWQIPNNRAAARRVPPEKEQAIDTQSATLSNSK